MSVEEGLKEVLLSGSGGESHLKCPSFCGPGFWTAEKGESELSGSIHRFLLPDCGYNVTGCLKVPLFLP